MKITYVATNRAHHYPYAEGLCRLNALKTFVSGFTRLSPRSHSPTLKDQLKRCDLWQTIYLLSLRLRFPNGVADIFNRASNAALDKASYSSARESDVFLYYRTTGVQTARRLKAENRNVVCILEEVNSHVEVCHELMKAEYESLDIGSYQERFPDADMRLQAYEEADYILCPSEWVKQSFVKKGFPENKILKNPYGMALSESSSRPQEKERGAFRILFVGQVHFRKGLRYLIEAFRLIKHPNKSLVIVGPQTAVTGLEKTSLPVGVTFTGILKGKELSDAYETANVFCLPSIEEGLALVMGEALSYGLSIVATSHTGAEDLFTDQIEGFIVPPCDIAALADRLQQLADDPDLRERLSTAALVRAQSLGGWDSSVASLLSTLKSVAQAKTLNQAR